MGRQILKTNFRRLGGQLNFLINNTKELTSFDLEVPLEGPRGQPEVHHSTQTLLVVEVRHMTAVHDLSTRNEQ